VFRRSRARTTAVGITSSRGRRSRNGAQRKLGRSPQYFDDRCGGTAILRRSPPTERASRDTPTSAQSYRRFCFFRFGLSRSPRRRIALSRACAVLAKFSVSGRIVCTRPARCHAGAPSSQGAPHRRGLLVRCDTWGDPWSERSAAAIAPPAQRHPRRWQRTVQFGLSGFSCQRRARHHHHDRDRRQAGVRGRRKAGTACRSGGPTDTGQAVPA